jgi:hypothetical protein
VDGCQASQQNNNRDEEVDDRMTSKSGMEKRRIMMYDMAKDTLWGKE